MTTPDPTGQVPWYGTSQDWSQIISGAGQGAGSAMQGASAYATSKREAKEAALMIRISPGAQTVKYADIIDNISTIVEHDPRFAKTHIEEKELYIYAMNRGWEPLHRMAIDATGTAKQKLTVNE